MSKLQQAFADLSSLDPQQRGKEFEKLIGLILGAENIRHRLAYRPTGEEIDGAFWWNAKTFLLEAKWHKDPAPVSLIYEFKGKLDGKFDGTIGVFISMSGYSSDCSEALVRGKNLNILLFDKTDIDAIVNGDSFSTVLTEKLFVAGQTGQIYMPLAKLKEIQSLTALAKEKLSEELPSKPLIIVCEGQTDRLILDSLVSHLCHEGLALENVQFLVQQGKGQLLERSLVPSLTRMMSGMLDSGIVLIVFDADTEDGDRANEQKRNMIDSLRDLPDSWAFHIAVAIPSIESWVNLEERKPIGKLADYLTTFNWSEQAKQIREINDVIKFLEKASANRIPLD